MIITCVGFKKVDFTAQQTGERITGYNVFYTAENQPNVKGLEAGKFFLSEAKAKQFDIQTETSYELFYNRYGKIESLVKI